MYAVAVLCTFNTINGVLPSHLSFSIPLSIPFFFFDFLLCLFCLKLDNIQFDFVSFS